MTALPDLEEMDRAALLSLWSATWPGEPAPPARLSRPCLRRLLAWELQARAHGGLAPATRRILDRLMAAEERRQVKPRGDDEVALRASTQNTEGLIEEGDAAAGHAMAPHSRASRAASPHAARALPVPGLPARAPRLKPGGRLLREWGGVTHVVDVVEGGFVWRGARHRSLSAIARAITGAHWSGPRFFGLGDAEVMKGAKTASGARGRGTTAGGTKASGTSTRSGAATQPQAGRGTPVTGSARRASPTRGGAT